MDTKYDGTGVNGRIKIRYFWKTAEKTFNFLFLEKQ